jgi:hypothetical protein
MERWIFADDGGLQCDTPRRVTCMQLSMWVCSTLRLPGLDTLILMTWFIQIVVRVLPGLVSKPRHTLCTVPQIA